VRIWYPLAFVVGSLIGGAALSVLAQGQFEVLIFASLFVAILLGWVAMFENRAVRYAGLFSWSGLFRPVWRQWLSPARPSWSIAALLFVVGLVAGGCVRVLLLSEA
jgi:hypothetical protein